MAVSIGQVTVPTSGSATAAHICDLPPGCVATLTTSATNADIYLGTANTVTSSNGAPLDPTGPTTLANPPGAKSFSLYGVAGTGTHVVGYIVITNR